MKGRILTAGIAVVGVLLVAGTRERWSVHPPAPPVRGRDVPRADARPSVSTGAAPTAQAPSPQPQGPGATEQLHRAFLELRATKIGTFHDCVRVLEDIGALLREHSEVRDGIEAEIASAETPTWVRVLLAYSLANWVRDERGDRLYIGLIGAKRDAITETATTCISLPPLAALTGDRFERYLVCEYYLATEGEEATEAPEWHKGLLQEQPTDDEMLEKSGILRNPMPGDGKRMAAAEMLRSLGIEDGFGQRRLSGASSAPLRERMVQLPHLPDTVWYLLSVEAPSMDLARRVATEDGRYYTEHEEAFEFLLHAGTFDGYARAIDAMKCAPELQWRVGSLLVGSALQNDGSKVDPLLRYLSDEYWRETKQSGRTEILQELCLCETEVSREGLQRIATQEQDVNLRLALCNTLERRGLDQCFSRAAALDIIRGLTNDPEPDVRAAALKAYAALSAPEGH